MLTKKHHLSFLLNDLTDVSVNANKFAVNKWNWLKICFGDNQLKVSCLDRRALLMGFPCSTSGSMKILFYRNEIQGSRYHILYCHIKELGIYYLYELEIDMYKTRTMREIAGETHAFFIRNWLQETVGSIFRKLINHPTQIQKANF